MIEKEIMNESRAYCAFLPVLKNQSVLRKKNKNL